MKLHGLQVFKHVFNHTPGPCRIVPGKGLGYEDMETLPNGLTLITSGLIMPTSSPKVKEYQKKHNGKGRIYLFDFNQPDKGIEELKIVGNQFNQSDFVPHDIGIWHDNTEKVIVLVVNHGSTHDSIEKFQFSAKDKQLTHLQTYIDPAIHFVNDVAMDSEESFYFTNYAYYKTPFYHLLEMMIPLRYGNLMYYDGNKFRKQDEGFVTPNGIVLSPDKMYLYMAEAVEKKVHTFRRHNNGTLTVHQALYLDTNPDNLLLDKDGNVLIGSHPIAWQALLHLDDPEHSAPSQVIKLYMKDGTVTRITELLSDDGHTLWGSTVASMYKDGMLVGTIQHKLLYCQVKWAD